MSSLTQAAAQALQLVAGADPKLTHIVLLSLRVSLTAVGISCVVGLPVGAAIAVSRFPGRHTVIVLLNALMGLPPVVVGLAVYLLLSRAGPLGALGLLFTPTAMVVAQTILITPIVAALSRQVVEDAWDEYRDQLRSLLGLPTTSIRATSSGTGQATRDRTSRPRRTGPRRASSSDAGRARADPRAHRSRSAARCLRRGAHARWPRPQRGGGAARRAAHDALRAQVRPSWRVLRSLRACPMRTGAPAPGTAV